MNIYSSILAAKPALEGLLVGQAVCYMDTLVDHSSSKQTFTS